MYRTKRIIAIAPAYNEGGKIGTLVKRIPRDLVDRILVVDDGSTDGTAEDAEKKGAEVIRLGEVLSVGAAIRRGIEFSFEHGYENNRGAGWE